MPKPPGASRPVSRKPFVFAILAACTFLAVPTQLHAATLYDYNYSFTLTDTANPADSGTGTFTLQLAAPPAAYTAYDYEYTAGNKNDTVALTALTVTIGSETFNLTDANASLTNAVVQFSAVPASATPGSTETLNDLTFSDTVTNGNPAMQYVFQSTADYVYESRCVTAGCSYTVNYGDYYSTHAGDATLVSVTTPPSGAVSTTPEPGSLVLLGTGLIGCAGSIFRRYRLQRS